MGLQNAALAQPPGAAGGLLRRLEQEQHIPGQFRDMDGHIFGQGQRHGGVAVMAAGVHLSGMNGGIGQSGGLSHRQGVHIRPEGHSLQLSGVEKGTDAAGDGGGDGTAQRLQNRTDVGRGLRQLVIQLRNAVQGTAVIDDRHQHASFKGNLCPQYSTSQSPGTGDTCFFVGFAKRIFPKTADFFKFSLETGDRR